ncbi:MAG: PKD domain-containing protein, partial [Pseudomonadota bacterium]|nr:PKD domain-containing protein [Pseudomonadota bacterium]
MTIYSTFARSITVLFILSLTLFLAGCDDNDNAGGVNITSNVQEGISPLAVQFDVETDEFLTGATWNFGDGTKVIPIEPDGSVEHTYTESGTYTVRYNAEGFGEPFTDEIQITVIPNVNLIVSSFAIDTEIDVVDPTNQETVSANIQ